MFEHAAEFTPLTLQLPPGLNPLDPSIRIRIEDVMDESGLVRLWKARKAVDRTFAEHLVAPYAFSLDALNYDSATGTIVVYAEALTTNRQHDTLEGVRAGGKPDSRIRATLVGNTGMALIDEVKYMVVEPLGFYPRLDSTNHVKNAFAAEAVYGLDDAPNYALKYLEADDVEKLISDLHPNDQQVIQDLLFYRKREQGDPPSSSVLGLKAGLYLDHTAKGGPNYVLAFAGTESEDLIDMIANLHQLLEPGSPQHMGAIELAFHLNRALDLRGHFETTGHSLGGSLAAAAAFSADIPADTYNAAGLQRHTLCDPITFDPENAIFCDPLIPDLDEGRAEDDGLNMLDRFDTKANALVKNYHVAAMASRFNGQDARDLLTFVQNTSPLLPSAVGLQVPIEGLKNLSAFQTGQLGLLKSGIQGISIIPDWPTAIVTVLGALLSSGLVNVLVESHSISESVMFGLLHNDEPVWNVYCDCPVGDWLD